jgi:hypothetical protein
MGDYGPATPQVERLISRVAITTLDEAADLYEAYAGRMLIRGWQAECHALARARRAAAVADLEEAYLRARHDAARAWRHALPPGQGPWLLIGRAIANAAGGLVIYTDLDDESSRMLIGPCRMAMGWSLEPVGPGLSKARRPQPVRLPG